MKFTVAAVTCMIEKDSKNIILDPDNNQLQVRKRNEIYLMKLISSSESSGIYPFLFFRMPWQFLPLRTIV